mmetsp:Transcript_32602/g.50720  ORF Transcript_32602/g.50720 Transcript_32602/m.50720 type:complete len:102 (-) Transcript_32602:48-353(-)|eukprot:CAMPEP_0184296188 /NCGR_PEP_ID=MMETSP1049-20130417/7170_1 /TAXON_ID=77928 /ORGANISM="Proteomonas sulcata, Strain CCMP704" /LENGTH=101 /DNA_ID=CAMNT_0026605275 /DNA_START=214 /DNA_END=519 /DNA_ORIENTATION=+
MKPTFVALARVPMIKFRHGRCNAGNTQAPSAASPMGGKKPAPPPRGDHVVKPLGPNVTIDTVDTILDLPPRFHRPLLSQEEMDMVMLGGAVDPPPPPKKKK